MGRLIRAKQGRSGCKTTRRYDQTLPNTSSRSKNRNEEPGREEEEEGKKGREELEDWTWVRLVPFYRVKTSLLISVKQASWISMSDGRNLWGFRKYKGHHVLFCTFCSIFSVVVHPPSGSYFFWSMFLCSPWGSCSHVYVGCSHKVQSVSLFQGVYFYFLWISKKIIKDKNRCSLKDGPGMYIRVGVAKFSRLTFPLSRKKPRKVNKDRKK